MTNSYSLIDVKGKGYIYYLIRNSMDESWNGGKVGIESRHILGEIGPEIANHNGRTKSSTLHWYTKPVYKQLPSEDLPVRFQLSQKMKNTLVKYDKNKF